MAKYRIIKQWSSTFNNHMYYIERYDTTYWNSLLSCYTLEEAEGELIKIKDRLKSAPEIIKEYEF